MSKPDYRQLAREAEDKAWAITSDDLRACWHDVAQAWLVLANYDDQRSPSRATSFHPASTCPDGGSMKQANADAIARFVQQGGQVNKVAATIPASEQDVLAYLEGCGLTVKRVSGDKPYSCRGRRYSINGLVRLANTYRATQQLAPLTLGRNVSAASGGLRRDQVTPG